MPQAVQQSTTRRALFAAAPAIALAGAGVAAPATSPALAQVIAEAERRGRDAQSFIEGVAWAHRKNGRAVASRVIEAGFTPDDVQWIVFRRADRDENAMPEIHVTDGARTIVFSPTGVL